MSLNARWHSLLGAVRESLVCLALAFRSSLRPGIVLRSAGLCLLVFAVWSWVFYRHFQPIGMAAGVVSVFVVMGGAVLGLLPGTGGTGGSVAGMAGIAPALAMLLVYAAVLTAAVLVVMYVGVIVATIRLALRWVLLGPVRERVQARYPALLAQPRPGPSGWLAGVRGWLGPWLGASLGMLLCLLVPVVNGVLLFLLLAYLNVRFLLGPALAGVANGEERMRVVRRQRGAMVVFGVLILLLALVPVVNLLLPALLGAGTCHLGYRGMEAERRADTGASAGVQRSSITSVR
ncbi:MAG: EI24 domain-containing protein [Pseudomonadota bacterium]